MDSAMPNEALSRLRWLTVLIPIILSIIFLYLLFTWGILSFQEWWGFALITAFVVGAILAFSTWVFQQVYKLESEALERNKQLEALNQAAVIVAGELELGHALQEIVEQSRSVLNARYSAISLFSESGGESSFHFSGISPETAAQMGSPPQGKGVLGEAMRQGKALRVPNIARHQASVGFPPNHPQMTAFLGIPVLSADKTIGLLYLADKNDGSVFTQSDEEIGKLLARQAATVIQNARLFNNNKEMTEDLTALLTIGKAVGSSLALEEVMERALETVIQVTSADFGEIWLTAAGSDEMVRACSKGELDAVFSERTKFRTGEGFPGMVTETGEPIIVHNLINEPLFLRSGVKEAGIMSMAALPLSHQNKRLGALVVAAKSDKSLSDEREITLLSGIAELIAMAISNGRLHSQVSRIAALEERERIAMDMHDGAIQSLYAVGLGLAGLSRSIHDGREFSRNMLDTLIQQLNQVILDIRSYILDTHPLIAAGSPLKERLQQIIDNSVRQGGIPVSLAVTDDAGGQLPPSYENHLAHIVTEAVSNIQRHSKAKSSAITFSKEKNQYVLQISDDGLGFYKDQSGAGKMGLRNIEARARLLGGSVNISSEPGKGTSIILRIPLGSEK